MFEDNFDNEDFMEMDGNMSHEDRIAAEKIYEKIIDRIVRANYDAIEKNGIDIKATKIHNLDENALKQLKYTLDFMIEYFINTEEYEKCAVLNKYIEEINN